MTQLPLETPIHSTPRLAPWELYALLAIAALALLLRLNHLTDRSLWLDEIFTVMLAAGHGVGFKEIPVGELLSHGPNLTGIGDVPIYRIPFHLQGDVHPPLVYLLLRFWIALGGMGDFWVRLFPVTFSVASCVCVYFPARRTLGPALALCVSAAMAVAMFEIYFAQEVRSYALLQLETILALWAAIIIVQDGVTTRRLVAWAGLSLAMVLTHYFALGAALGLGAFLLLAVPPKTRWRVAAAGGLAALAFLLLWGPFLRQQLSGGLTGNHMAALAANSITDLSIRALTFLPRTLLPGLPQDSIPLAFLAAAVLLAAVIVAFRAQKLLFVWVALFAGSLLLQGVIDLCKGMITLQFPRYSFHVTPAVYVCVAGLTLQLLRRGRAVKLLSGLLVVAIAATSLALYGYRPKSSWRELAQFIDRSTTPADVLVFLSDKSNDDRPGMNYMCLAHYSSKTRELPVLLLDPAHPATPETLAKLTTFRRVFVLTPTPNNNPPPLPGLIPLAGTGFAQYTADATATVWEMEPSPK